MSTYRDSSITQEKAKNFYGEKSGTAKEQTDILQNENSIPKSYIWGMNFKVHLGYSKF